MLPPPSKQPPRRLFIQARRTQQEVALSQWRPLETNGDSRVQARKSRSVSELIPHVLKSWGMEKKLESAEVLNSWNQLMDPNITAHAQPTGFRNGTLFVSVDSNVWLDEIVRYRRKEILDRLQHTFGREAIKRISFRAG